MRPWSQWVLLAAVTAAPGLETAQQEMPEESPEGY